MGVHKFLQSVLTRLRFLRVPFFVFLGIAAIYGVYSYFFSKDGGAGNITTTTTITVEKTDIQDAIEVMGKAELANEQRLRFGQPGKVTDILVDIGDVVAKDQVLAVLDKREFYQELAQVQNRIDKTKHEIQEERQKATGTEARRMEREIASLERKLAEAEEEFSRLVTHSPAKAEEKLLALNAKKRELQTQKNKLALDTKSYESEVAAQETLIAAKIEQGQKTAKDTIQSTTSTLSELRSLQIGLNRIFGFEESWLTSEELSIARRLSYEAIGRYDDVRSSWNQSRGLVHDYQRMIENIRRDNTQSETARGIISEQIRVYRSFLETADLARRALDLTPVSEWYGVSSSELASLQNTVSGYRANISGKISALTEQHDELIVSDSPEKIREKFLSELHIKKTSLDELSDSIKKMELQIHTDEQMIEVVGTGRVISSEIRREVLEKQSGIQDQKDAIITKKEDLDKLRRGKSSALENLESTLKDQYAELEKLKAKEESYEIRAPFTGTIRTVKLKVGDVLRNDTGDNEKVILLENSDLLHIKVALNQLDIIKVALNQPAQIQFEAVPNVVLSGKITEISSTPSGGENGGVGWWGGNLATYDIVVSAPRENHPIYSGMNARVSITLDTRKDVLIIPLTAVSEDPLTGDNVVNVIADNGTIVKTPIITGISKNHQVEVLEGLTEWQQIQIVDFDANTYSHEDFTSSQFFY